MDYFKELSTAKSSVTQSQVAGPTATTGQQVAFEMGLCRLVGRTSEQ